MEYWGRKDKIKEAHMQITISFPRPSNVSTNEEARSFLKQLELSVHHAQKSLEELIKMSKESGEDTEFTLVYKVGEAMDNDGNDVVENGPYSSDMIDIEIYPA